jgi:integrase/recombinase XerD
MKIRTRQFSITPFWDTRTMDDKTKQSRVMLTINLNRKQFRITLKLRCTKAEFDAAITSRSANAKELRRAIHDYIDKAETILNRLPSPTKENFIRFFKSETDLSIADKTDALVVFSAKMDELKKEKRFGSLQNCKAAYNSLKRYSSDLYFEEIDLSFLKGYIVFMLNEGHSSTTAQIYLRNLRTIFRKAIKDGYISEKYYPFKDFTIGSSTKSKSVLYPEQIKALWEYTPVRIRESRAKSFWFFCYLCNGVNFKDLPHLRYKNVKGGILSFVRQKTKRTSKEVKEITVHLHDEAKRIIEEWGNPSRKPDDYIFPLMKKYKDELHMDKTINRYKRICNSALKKIGKKLGFDFPLVLNLARHSFATKLKLSGTPVAFIKDALGHGDMKVTEHYMKGLPDSNLKQMTDSLLNF